MQETQVQSLGQEDPLEKGMTTHSSILAWEIPWTEEPGRIESMGTQRFAQNLPTKQQKLCVFSDIGRGSQCKCRTETEQKMANEDLSRPHKGTHLYMRAFTSAHRNT